MSPYTPPTCITLISHAATREQKAGIFPGDESLDARALAELATVAWRPAGNSRILTAPELRTRQTAEALELGATAMGDLRDCDFGRWRGRSLEALHEEEISGLSQWLGDVNAAPHGGESFRDLMIRVGIWLDAQREAGPVVAVTHASVVRATVVCALQVSPDEAFLRIEVAPLTATDIRFSGGHWRVRSVGVPLLAAVGLTEPP
jgi:broad specificity phosphatase PhoE